jgi:hypothetical protein
LRVVCCGRYPKKKEIRDLFESFCEQNKTYPDLEMIDPDEHDTYMDPEAVDESLACRRTIGGQKEIFMSTLTYFFLPVLFLQ